MSDEGLKNEDWKLESGEPAAARMPLGPGESLEVRVMARVLLDLRGVAALSGAERDLCEAVLEAEALLLTDDRDVVREMYEQREREAALRGETWEGGGL